MTIKIKGVELDAFNISNDVVLPTLGRRGPKQNHHYPFKEMKVGDSFIGPEPYSRHSMSKISNAARNWKNKVGNEDWRFVVRATEDNKIIVFREK